MTDQAEAPGPGIPGTESSALVARVVAAGIDTVIVAVLVSVYALVLLDVGFEEMPVAIYSALLYAVYFALTETYWAMTPGKMVCGVIVVTEDGDPASPPAVLVRTVLRAVDGLFYYGIALLVVLGNDRRQRLGDMAAETVVVERRGEKNRFARWVLSYSL